MLRLYALALAILGGGGCREAREEGFTSSTIQQFTDSCLAGGIPSADCACMIGEIEKGFTEEHFLDIDRQRLHGVTPDRWTVMRLNRIAKACDPLHRTILFGKSSPYATSEGGDKTAMDPAVAAGVICGAAAVSLGYYFAIAAPRNRRRKKGADERRERDHQERAEADAAQALAGIALPSLHVLLADIDALTADFGALKTFADVASYRAKAIHVADVLEATCREQLTRIDEVRALMASYETTTRDPPHVAAATLAKTEQQVSASSALVTKLTLVYETLSERLDMSPSNATEQRAFLKNLRAERKDLAARKKEAKASRRRSGPAAAPPSPWSRKCTHKLASTERWAMRSSRDAEFGPDDDDVAALDRWILVIEQRIGWVQRFGGENDRSAATTEPL